MILQCIFQSAALTAVHTGAAAGIAAAMGSENAASAGLTSFALGIPALLAGAYVGGNLTTQPDNGETQDTAAIIGGLIGYAAGSVAGIALRLS